MPNVVIDQGVVQTVVDAATGTGTGKSTPFTLRASPVGQPRLAAYQCSGTYSVCTANLQQSMDGGSTWQDVGAAVDLAASPAGNITTFFATALLVPGAVYQFSIASFTGTSITIEVTPT